MSTLTLEHEPSIENIEIHNNILTIELDDKRTVSVPLNWYPRLQNATVDELNDWQRKRVGRHIQQLLHRRLDSGNRLGINFL